MHETVDPTVTVGEGCRPLPGSRGIEQIDDVGVDLADLGGQCVESFPIASADTGPRATLDEPSNDGRAEVPGTARDGQDATLECLPHSATLATLSPALRLPRAPCSSVDRAAVLLTKRRFTGLAMPFLEHRERVLRDMPRRHREWIRRIERESDVQDILWSQNPAYAVRREFAPREEDTIVKKTAFGAFTSSTIDETLRSLELDTIVVGGISTNCCVSTTVRDAADLGYGVVLVEECTADYDAVTHDVAIRGLHFNFARVVVTVDEFVGALDARRDV